MPSFTFGRERSSRSAAIALVLVAGELGQRAAEVRESDEGGGESWGATEGNGSWG